MCRYTRLRALKTMYGMSFHINYAEGPLDVGLNSEVLSRIFLKLFFRMCGIMLLLILFCAPTSKVAKSRGWRGDLSEKPACCNILAFFSTLQSSNFYQIAMCVAVRT